MATPDWVYQLEITTGQAKGRRWDVTEKPQIIGRAILCPIQIDDPLVSRRHCQVWFENGRAWLKDLGSSNALLVNGRPVHDSELAVGDKIAIGSSVLTVSLREYEDTPVAAAVFSTPTPATLHLSDATYLQAVSSSESAPAPRTVAELHELFSVSRRFSVAVSLADLVGHFADHLMDKFHPQALWVAEYIHGDDHLAFHSFDGASPLQEAPQEMMLRIICSNMGSVVPSRVVREHKRHFETTMIAPITYGNDRVGGVAVRTRLPHGAYDGSDLHYLLALASTLAPFIRAVERLEQLQRDRNQAGVSGADIKELIGHSPRLDHVREMARKAALSRLPVVLFGESGTGKELVARMIHDQSPRAKQPYVTVNCAAIPENLFESEMFGHEKGAFTGAVERKIGRFEEAHSGTIFLDEIPDLSAANQARMLRVLETGLFYPVGATREIHVETCIIAATNRSLPDLIAEGKFRQDLYYRLQGIVIELPPLRSIVEDIPLLAKNFLEATHGRVPHIVNAIAPEAVHLLQAWSWPGNVRELRACIERAACMAETDTLTPEGLAVPAGSAMTSPGAEDRLLSLAEVEKQHIMRVLRHCGGKVRTAARELGISHVTLYAKLQQYGVDC